MSLPAVDLKFLSNVSRRLQERALHVYVPGDSRSSVAIIFRFGDDRQQHAVRRLLAGAKEVQQVFQRHLSAGIGMDLPSTLQVLLVRRLDLVKDRWSGSVTYPGGRRDRGDADDYSALCARVNEMLGIPLTSSEFLLLGRLRDYPIRSRRLQLGGMVQSRFVFLHIGELAPTLRFASHMVEAARWIPFSALEVNQRCARSTVSHPLRSFVHPSDAETRLLLTELFPHACLSFPAVQVPDQQWKVWGLALRSASELMALDDRSTADWPLVSSNNALLQHFVIDPLHGYYELLYTYHRVRGQWGRKGNELRNLSRCDVIPPTCHPILWAVSDEANPRHVFFLLLCAAFVTMMAYAIATVVHGACTVVRLAFGCNEGDGFERTLGYCTASNNDGEV
ncbi:NUDIX family hydrolase, putative [Trypanosoma equiperdum]|uniref:Nudix hydrolase domain-containing protein n=2 Tax=Trypanozoon TaxID=39700 RepID=Q580H1_TRYB2|nr:hypothetical protein, conserved [Trypanosoma brucei brucei TREU927]AAX79788.1 hypothetical protein, conserved [Trypanosoma brucei]AAZ12920.1 hypothetical protein, conserved [Trypanosoma brucei brucei TREU927]SCU65214.1 NUDIX family hydrolase, putative [Trypanosoma equiperdum]